MINKKNDVRKTASTLNSKWLKNTLKSMGIAGTEMIKDLMPATSETVISAASATSEAVRNIKANKNNTKSIESSIKNNPAIKLGQDYFKNALADIKSGNFYNTERDGFDSDDSSGSDISFDDFDDIFPEDESPDINVINEGSSNGNEATIHALNRNAEYQVQSAKATVDTMVSIASSSIAASSQANQQLLSEVSKINSNLSALLDYQTQNMTKFIDASIGFYEQMAGKKEDSNSQTKISSEDIYSSNGGIDFSQYKEYVKQNISNASNSSMGGSMIKMLFENKEMLGTLVSNPLGGFMKMGMKSLIPEITRSAMENLDKSMKDFFPVMLERIGELGQDDTSMFGGVARTIGNILGVKTNRKKNFDLSKIDKGPMPYNGIANHTITEIIPKYLRESNTYLREIAESITGKSNSELSQNIAGFDWETGTFKNLEEMRKNVYDEIEMRTTQTFKDSHFGEKMASQKSLLKNENDRNNYDKALDQLYLAMEKQEGKLDFKNKNQMSSIMNDINASDNIKNLIESYINHMLENSDAAIGNAIATKQKATREHNLAMKDVEENAQQRGLRQFADQEDYEKYINRKYKSNATIGQNSVSPKTSNVSTVSILQGIQNTLNKGIYVVVKRKLNDNAPLVDSNNATASDNISTSTPSSQVSQSKDEFKTEFVKQDENTKDQLNIETTGYDGKPVRGAGSAKQINAFTGVINGIMAGNADSAWDGFMQGISSKLKQAGEYLSEHFFAPMKKHLFGEKDENGYIQGGIFGGVNNRMKESFFSLRRMITGKGYTTADGTSVADANEEEMKNTVAGKLKNMLNGLKEGISIRLFGKKDEDGETITDENGKPVKESILTKTKKSLSNGVSSFMKGLTGWKHALFGKESDDEDEEEAGRKTWESIKDKTKDVLPSAMTGVATGGILGTLVGGPLAGALIGMTTGILSRSDKFKNWLFGEKDEDGNRMGGAISKKVQDYVKENGKFLAGGAAIGAVRGSITGGGFLGTLVGGPIAGALMGVATSMIVKSDSFQKFLYGDEKAGQKGLVNIVKGWFGKLGRGKDGKVSGSKEAGMLGIGAGVGALTIGAISKSGILGLSLGPAGPIGGAILGLGASILATKNNFKEWLFGKEDPETHTKREGVLGKFKNMLTANVIRPMINTAKDIGEGFKSFLYHKVFARFNNFVNIVGGSIFGNLVDLGHKAIETVGDFGTYIKDNYLDKLIDNAQKILTSITKGITLAAKGISSITKKIIGTPFAMMNAIVSPIGRAVGNAFKGVGHAISGSVKWLVIKPIKNLVLKPLTTAVGAATKIISAPFKAVGKVTDILSTGITNVTHRLGLFFHNLGYEFKDWFFHKNPVARGLRKVGDGIKNFGARIKDTYKILVSPLTTFVKNALTEVKDTIKQSVQRFFHYLNPLTWIKGLGKGIKKLFGRDDSKNNSEKDPSKMGMIRRAWYLAKQGDMIDATLSGTKDVTDAESRKLAKKNAKYGKKRVYFENKETGVTFWECEDKEHYDVYEVGQRKPVAKITKSQLPQGLVKKTTGVDGKYAVIFNKKFRKKQSENERLIDKWTKHQRVDDTIENREIAIENARKAGVDISSKFHNIDTRDSKKVEEAKEAQQDIKNIEENTGDTVGVLQTIRDYMIANGKKRQEIKEKVNKEKAALEKKKHDEEIKKKAAWLRGNEHFNDDVKKDIKEDAIQRGSNYATTVTGDSYKNAGKKSRKKLDETVGKERSDFYSSYIEKYGRRRGLFESFKATINEIQSGVKTVNNKYKNQAKESDESDIKANDTEKDFFEGWDRTRDIVVNKHGKPLFYGNKKTTKKSSKDATVNNDIPKHAIGTTSAKKGYAIVGENGPEVMYNKDSTTGKFVGVNGPEVVNMQGGETIIPNNKISDKKNDTTVSEFSKVSDDSLIKTKDTKKLTIGERIIKGLVDLKDITKSKFTSDNDKTKDDNKYDDKFDIGPEEDYDTTNINKFKNGITGGIGRIGRTLINMLPGGHILNNILGGTLSVAKGAGVTLGAGKELAHIAKSKVQRRLKKITNFFRRDKKNKDTPVNTEEISDIPDSTGAAHRKELAEQNDSSATIEKPDTQDSDIRNIKNISDIPGSARVKVKKHKKGSSEDDKSATIKSEDVKKEEERKEAKEKANAALADVTDSTGAAHRKELAEQNEIDSDNEREDSILRTTQIIADTVKKHTLSFNFLFGKKGKLALLATMLPFTFKFFKSFWNNLDTGATRTIKDAINNIDLHLPTLTEIKDFVKDIPENIKKLPGIIKDTIKDVLGKSYDTIKGAIFTIRDTTVEWAKRFGVDFHFGMDSLGDGDDWKDKLWDNATRFSGSYDENGNIDHQTGARNKLKYRYRSRYALMARDKIKNISSDPIFGRMSNLWDKYLKDHVNDFGKKTRDMFSYMKTTTSDVFYKMKNSTAANAVVSKAGNVKNAVVSKAGNFGDDVTKKLTANVAKEAAEETTESLWTKVTKLIRDGFNGILDKISKKTGKKAVSKVAAGSVDDVMKNVSKCKKFFGKVTEKISKILGLTAGLAATGVGLLAKEGTWIAIGTLSGATGAKRLFQVDETDSLMTIISTAIGALTGTTVGSIIDVINELVVSVLGIDIISQFACLVYSTIQNLSGNKEAVDALNKARDEFKNKYEDATIEQYKEQYETQKAIGAIGPNVTLEQFEQGVKDGTYSASIKSFADYNDDEHQTTVSKIGAGLKKSLTPLKNSLFGYTEVTKTDTSGNVYTQNEDGTWQVVTKDGKDLGYITEDAIPDGAVEDVKKTEGSLVKLGKTLMDLLKPILHGAIELLPTITTSIGYIAAGNPIKLFTDNKTDSDNGIVKALGLGVKLAGFAPAVMSWAGQGIFKIITPIINSLAVGVSDLGANVADDINRITKGDISGIWKTKPTSDAPGLSWLSTGLGYGLKAISTIFAVPVWVKNQFSSITGWFKKAGDAIKTNTKNMGDAIDQVSDMAVEGHGIDLWNVDLKRVDNDPLFWLWETILFGSKLVGTVRGAFNSVENMFDDLFGGTKDSIKNKLGQYSGSKNESDDNSTERSKENSDNSDNSETSTSNYYDTIRYTEEVGSERRLFTPVGGYGNNQTHGLYLVENKRPTYNNRRIFGGYGDESETSSSNHINIENNSTPVENVTPKSSISNSEPDKLNGIKYFSQNDPRWSNINYKKSNGSDDNATIGDSGCGPVAMAMVTSTMTNNNITPVKMANMATDLGYRDDSGTNMGFIENAARVSNLSATEYTEPTVNLMKTNLQKKDPIVLLGSSNGDMSSPYTPSGHYLVATGIDSNDDVFINDPRGSRYSGKVNINRIIPQTRAMWSFSGRDISRKRSSSHGRRVRILNKSLQKRIMAGTIGGKGGLDPQTVMDIAIAEEGYTEHKSASKLDKKNGNKGNNNYQKYSKELYGTDNMEWCAAFVTWCFYQALDKNKDSVSNTLYGLAWGDTMSCSKWKKTFKDNNSYYSKDPQPGDCVLFNWADSRGDGVDHIGLVISYDGNNIITVEGNTSDDGSDFEGVCAKTYSIKDSQIDGYCRPKYGLQLSWDQVNEIPKSLLNKSNNDNKDDDSVIGKFTNNLSKLSTAIFNAAITGNWDIDWDKIFNDNEVAAANSTDATIATNGDASTIDDIPAASIELEPSVSSEAERIFNYLTYGKNFTKEAAAGILGNLYAMSGLRSNNLDDSYEEKLDTTDEAFTASVDKEDSDISKRLFVGDNSNIFGYGLPQFKTKDEKTLLYDNAKSNKSSVSDSIIQLNVLNEYLKKNLPDIITNTDLRSVSDSMLYDYEKPKDQSPDIADERYSYSKYFYEKLFDLPQKNVKTESDAKYYYGSVNTNTSTLKPLGSSTTNVEDAYKSYKLTDQDIDFIREANEYVGYKGPINSTSDYKMAEHTKNHLQKIPTVSSASDSRLIEMDEATMKARKKRGGSADDVLLNERIRRISNFYKSRGLSMSPQVTAAIRKDTDSQVVIDAIKYDLEHRMEKEQNYVATQLKELNKFNASIAEINKENAKVDPNDEVAVWNATHMFTDEGVFQNLKTEKLIQNAEPPIYDQESIAELGERASGFRYTGNGRYVKQPVDKIAQYWITKQASIGNPYALHPIINDVATNSDSVWLDPNLISDEVWHEMQDRLDTYNTEVNKDTFKRMFESWAGMGLVAASIGAPKISEYVGQGVQGVIGVGSNVAGKATSAAGKVAGAASHIPLPGGTILRYIGKGADLLGKGTSTVGTKGINGFKNGGRASRNIGRATLATAGGALILDAMVGKNKKLEDMQLAQTTVNWNEAFANGLSYDVSDINYDDTKVFPKNYDSEIEEEIAAWAKQGVSREDALRLMQGGSGTGHGYNSSKNVRVGGGRGEAAPSKINGKTYFSQNDPRWSSKKFIRSDGMDDDATIGDSGCGPMAMAMAVSDVTGKKTDPMKLARYAQDNGFRDETGTGWGFVDSAAYSLGMRSSRHIDPTGDDIKKSLKSGKSMVLSGASISNDSRMPYTSAGHYVVATGLDPNGNIKINDPRGLKYNKTINPDVLAMDTQMAWTFSNDVNASAIMHGGFGLNPYKKKRRRIRGGRGNATNCPYVGTFHVAQEYKGSAHDGMDIIGDTGKDLHATCNGTVEHAGWENPSNQSQGFGQYVMIYNGSGYDFYYGHMSEICVNVGDTVTKGQKIGVEGNTGYSTGAHCHYCIRKHGSRESINVADYMGIPNEQGSYSSDMISTNANISSASISNTTSSTSEAYKTGAERAMDKYSSLLGKVGAKMGQAGLTNNYDIDWNSVLTDPEPVSTSTTGTSLSSSGTLSGNDNKTKIYNYLTSNGLSPAGASAVIGNWMQESGLMPNNLQNDFESREGMNDEEYTAAVNNGTISKQRFIDSVSRDNVGYGLAQWTYNTRKKGLYEATVEKGIPIDDLKAQMDYFFYEMRTNNGFKGLEDRLRNATNVDQATIDFQDIFEGCIEGSEGKRAANARSIYNEFGGKGGGRGNGTGGQESIETAPTIRNKKYDTSNSHQNKTTETATEQTPVRTRYNPAMSSQQKSISQTNNIYFNTDNLEKILKDISSLIVSIVNNTGNLSSLNDIKSGLENIGNTNTFVTSNNVTNNSNAVKSQQKKTQPKSSSKMSRDEEIARRIAFG